MHILLVDDDVGCLSAMRTALTVMGHTCDEFSDPEQALRSSLSRLNEYGAVVTDLKMPEIDGLRLAEILLEAVPELKVVIVSGQAKADRLLVSKQSGVSAVLAKPINIVELAAALKQ